MSSYFDKCLKKNSFDWELNFFFFFKFSVKTCPTFHFFFFFHLETLIINCQFQNIFQINFFESFSQLSHFLPQEVLGYFSNEILTENTLTNSSKILHLSRAITLTVNPCSPYAALYISGNTSEWSVFPVISHFIQFLHCFYCYILEYWIQTSL